jgi:hypothetical protein
MCRAGFRAAAMSAVVAATKRSEELKKAAQAPVDK